MWALQFVLECLSEERLCAVTSVMNPSSYYRTTNIGYQQLYCLPSTAWRSNMWTHTRQTMFLSVYTSQLLHERVMQNVLTGSHPSLTWWHFVKPRERHTWMLWLWPCYTSFSGLFELIKRIIASRCYTVLSVFTHLICTPQMRLRTIINNVSESTNKREGYPLRLLHSLTRLRVYIRTRYCIQMCIDATM